jgi:tRNA A37 threonylcarbamoyladenosine dehydratase
MIENDRFDGVKRVYTQESFKILQKLHFLVVGIGGIGSWACESFIRSGIGELTIVDLDDICISNTNRQIHAHEGNYGKMKVDVMKDRLLQINPEAKINIIENFFSETSKDEILNKDYDYVLDCIDSVKSKCILISECRKRGIKIMVTGGAGGKFDPRFVTIKDINKANNDPLVQTVRRKLKTTYNFPKSSADFGIPCTFSPENRTLPEIGKDEFSATRGINCQNGFGSLTFVTGTFAFIATSFIINDVLGKEAVAEVKTKGRRHSK